MCQEIGNFTYEKQTNGTFLYKSKESIVSTSKKLKDKVQYKVIDDIEKSLKTSGSSMINNSVEQIIKFIAE